MGAPSKAPVAGFARSSTSISARPPRASGPQRESHLRPQWQDPARASPGSWPHRGLHRRPQRRGSHAVPLPFRRTPHPVRGPIGSSTAGPSGGVRMQFHFHFGARLA
eukprot:5083057-Pyramimonas_sp.AAC.1